MKKIILICVLALSVSSCTTITGAIQSNVEKGRNAIREYCTGIHESYRVAFALMVAKQVLSCKAVARTQAIVDANKAICTNVNTLTIAQLVAAGKKLVTDWRNAQTAVGAGC